MASCNRPLSAEDAAALAQHFKRQRPSKYRNVKTVVDGITFDSKKEARRYQELLLLEKAGHIRDLERQVTYPLTVNNQKIASYRADFRYFDVGHVGWIVEDSKGVRTKEYILKCKLMKALWGVDILET